MEIWEGYISGGDKMKKGRNFYRKYKFKVAMWIVFREEFKSEFYKKIDFQGENQFFDFFPTNFFFGQTRIWTPLRKSCMLHTSQLWILDKNSPFLNMKQVIPNYGQASL